MLIYNRRDQAEHIARQAPCNPEIEPAQVGTFSVSFFRGDFPADALTAGHLIMIPSALPHDDGCKAA